LEVKEIDEVKEIEEKIGAGRTKGLGEVAADSWRPMLT